MAQYITAPKTCNVVVGKEFFFFKIIIQKSSSNILNWSCHRFILEIKIKTIAHISFFLKYY